MEDKLRYVLGAVNEWLKFAEAKNGALVAVDIGILFGLFQLADDVSSKGWIYMAIFSVTLSAVCALISFSPQLGIPSFPRLRKPGKEGSLIFYGHIAKYEPEAYVRAIFSEAGKDVPATISMELDYARQIITNSRIALKKYCYFSVGLWLAVLGLLFLFVSTLLSATRV